MIADARDEVVSQIAQRPRDDGDDRGENSASSAEAAKNMNERVRTDEQRAAFGLNGHGIGQGSSLLHRNACLKRNSLEWGESERGARAIVFENKLHRAMAQAAIPVVEEHLSLRQ